MEPNVRAYADSCQEEEPTKRGTSTRGRRTEDAERKRLERASEHDTLIRLRPVAYAMGSSLGLQAPKRLSRTQANNWATFILEMYLRKFRPKRNRTKDEPNKP